MTRSSLDFSANMDAARIKKWSESLHRTATQPLEMCPQFPQIAQRFEAWWHQEMIDRPLLVAAPANPTIDQPAGRHLDLLHDAEAWRKAKRQDLHRMVWVGDSIPHVRVDFGPAMLGTLLGVPFHFESDTTWYDPTIGDDWKNSDVWTIDPDDQWWRRLCDLSDQVSKDAAGRYLFCTPAYEASADVITNLRGATEICLDIADRPDVVRQSIEALHSVWAQVISMFYDTVERHDAGLTTWMRIWSSEPFTTLAADVGYMIGQDEFRQIILPSIEREARLMGRAIFHVDGPPMLRHLDALFEISQIRVIQFTPGAGTPSVLPYIDTFKRVQDSGRSLLIIAQPEEVLPLCQSLDPTGLAILLDAVPPVDQLNQLFSEVCRAFGVQSVV